MNSHDRREERKRPKQTKQAQAEKKKESSQDIRRPEPMPKYSEKLRRPFLGESRIL